MRLYETIFSLRKLKAKHATAGLDNFQSDPNEAYRQITKSMALGLLCEFVEALDNGFVILPTEEIILTDKIGGCREAVKKGYIF